MNPIHFLSSSNVISLKNQYITLNYEEFSAGKFEKYWCGCWAVGTTILMWAMNLIRDTHSRKLTKTRLKCCLLPFRKNWVICFKFQIWYSLGRLKMQLQNKLINPKLKSYLQSRHPFLVHKDKAFIWLNFIFLFPWWSPCPSINWSNFCFSSLYSDFFHSPIIFSFSFSLECIYAFPIFQYLYLDHMYV